MRRAAGRLLVLAGYAVLLGACSVPRATPRPIDPAAFPTEQNLLRAREALQDRIAEEKEHVEALQQQLVSLRKAEESLYATFLQAESEYQLREHDLAGVEGDLARSQQALADTQGRLAEVTAQLLDSQTRLAALVDQVRAVLEALAELEAALAEGRRDDLAAIIAKIPPQLLPPLPAPAPPPDGGAAGAGEGGGN